MNEVVTTNRSLTPTLSSGLFLLCLLFHASGVSQELNKPSTGAGVYTLKVSVDEVNLTFHVSDFQGRAMDDLGLNDLRLRDNGKPPQQVVSFHVFHDLPIRAGILFDTSPSMLGNLMLNQQIASRYAAHMLHASRDRAFVMRFDSDVKVKQAWTDDAEALTSSIGRVAEDAGSRIGGTALFDSVYKVCRDQWKSERGEPTGNFLMLFTDGIDNASHARMEDVIDICQENRVSIYVFSDESNSIFAKGQKVLQELAAQSGGRVFFDQTEQKIVHDLRSIEGDQRSQYRLVYKPVLLKVDGSFHRLQLTSPTRGGVITVRSGYYAPR